jgi:hypothetical protein
MASSYQQILLSDLFLVLAEAANNAAVITMFGAMLWKKVHHHG